MACTAAGVAGGRKAEAEFAVAGDPSEEVTERTSTWSMISLSKRGRLEAGLAAFDPAEVHSHTN